MSPKVPQPDTPPANCDQDIATTRYRFNPATHRHERQSARQRFIAGPIPYDWMQRANHLPGKAGAVGLSLWFLKGLKGSGPVPLTAECQRLAGCSRQALSRALAVLAAAGLISVVRKPGARAIVTLLKGN